LPIRKPVEEDPKNKTKLSKQKLDSIIHHRLDYEPQEPNSYFMKVIEPIVNKWFNLRDFIKILKSIGLNIFPEEDSDKFVNITSKVFIYLLIYQHIFFKFLVKFYLTKE
jgi:hypothetical protein